MKKILVALAAMALVGAAQAQQNPTTSVYGLMDVGIRYETHVTATDDSATKLINGNTYTSRFGIISSEDLGNGTTIKLKLESGLSPTTGVSGNSGSTGTVLFDRQAWVGFADKTFGEVQIGRNTLATYDFATGGVGDLTLAKGESAAQPANTSNSTYAVAPLRAAQINVFTGATSSIRNSRSDGLIKWSNKLGPVNVTLGIAPGGQSGSDSKKSTTTAAVTYSLNSLTVGAANFTAKDAADLKYSVNGIGAKYDIGNWTLQSARWTSKSEAGYVAANLTTNGTYTGPVLGTAATTGPSTDASLNTLGVQYRVSPKLTTTLSSYHGQYANGVGKAGVLNSQIVLAEYDVTKRTTFYGILDRASASGDIASTTITRPIVGYNVGVKHTF